MKASSHLPKVTTILLLLSLIPCLIFGQDDIRKNVEDYLQSVRDSFPGVPGIHVIVADKDHILFSVSAGFADMEDSIPFTSETGLYIASNTKTFVGLAMARLIEDGKIGFDDSITKYLDRSYFPDSIDADQIYIRDLPGHTHGLSNDGMTFRTAFAGSAPDSLLPSLLKYTSYAFHLPAKKFRYNNFSYLLCGMIIEKVTGLSWRDYLLKNILQPAGLTHTTPYYSDYDNNPVAGNYLYDRPGEKLDFTKQDNTMHAAGGLISTDEDMVRWLQLFMNDGEVNGKQLLDSTYFQRAKTLLASDTGNMGPFQRYGCAYAWIKGQFNGELLYFHFGNYTGSGCMMSFMPEKDLAVFAFVNEGDGGLFLSALASTYVYNLMLNKENTAQISKLVLNYVKKTYAENENKTLIPVWLKNFPIQTPHMLVNEAYGNLQFYPDKKQMMVRFGNMLSPVFEGDSTGYYQVEWVPDEIEWIKMDKRGERFEVQYEDYGVFK